MEKVLLILESNDLYRPLSDALPNQLVRSCSPEAAPEVLRQFQPNVLVLDLFLPGTDGFLLMEANKDLLPHGILLLTVLDSNYVRARSAQLGVDFVIRKPCCTDYIVNHLTKILLIHQFPEPVDSEFLAEHLLNRFPIQAKERVMRALRQALLLAAEDPDCLLTKDIYKEVSQDFGTTTDAVDQAIRRTLRKAWHNKSKDSSTWDLFFPGQETCPTNGTFIATLATYLRKSTPPVSGRGKDCPEDVSKRHQLFK